MVTSTTTDIQTQLPGSTHWNLIVLNPAPESTQASVESSQRWPVMDIMYRDTNSAITLNIRNYYLHQPIFMWVFRIHSADNDVFTICSSDHPDFHYRSSDWIVTLAQYTLKHFMCYTMQLAHDTWFIVSSSVSITGRSEVSNTGSIHQFTVHQFTVITCNPQHLLQDWLSWVK